MLFSSRGPLPEDTPLSSWPHTRKWTHFYHHRPSPTGDFCFWVLHQVSLKNRLHVERAAGSHPPQVKGCEQTLGARRVEYEQGVCRDHIEETSTQHPGALIPHFPDSLWWKRWLNLQRNGCSNSKFHTACTCYTHELIITVHVAECLAGNRCHSKPLMCINSLYPPTRLWGCYYHQPSFADEQTKTQKD